MSYILKAVRPSNLQSWISANAPGSLKATARESWRAYLAANSGTGSTLRDQESAFLSGQAVATGTGHDRWASFNSGQSGGKGPEKARNRYK